MGVFKVRLVALSFLLVTACATFNAKRSFNNAEKAKKAGDYAAAIHGYEEAAKADPKKPEYKKALEETRKEAATLRATAALDAEKRGDFEAAAKLWSEAQQIDPSSSEYAARIELARLKTKRADPVEYYEAAKKLQAALPADEGAKKTLDEAKQDAVAYHLRLAETYTEAKSWTQASAEFDIAKRIDPQNAVFKSAGYRGVEARQLESLGDERMKAGDSLGAYQAYEKAAALTNDHNLEVKMSRAKKGAGSTLEQLDQAEQYEKLGKWEDAADIYSVVAVRSNAPQNVAERATIARAKSAKARADRAKAYADRNLPQKACAEALLALEHTDAPKEVLDLLMSAFEDLTSGNAGEASRKISAAAASQPSLALVVVAPDIALSVAKSAYEEAQKLAEAHPADAMLALSKLEPFSAKLTGYAAFQTKLTKRAFGALITEAERAGDAGKYEQATEMLQAALQVSKPPPELADNLKKGTSALGNKDYERALRAFDAALAASGKSNLAKAGRKVAVAGRLAELRIEAKDARVAEDSVRAATAYRAILTLDPNDVDAKMGTAELRDQLVGGALRAAKEHAAAGRTGAAFVYYRRVLDLEPANTEAKDGLEKMRAQLVPAGAVHDPEAIVALITASDDAAQKCPALAAGLRDRLALYLSKTPKLGAKYLEHDQVKAVDDKKRDAPPIVLKTSLESCALEAAAGTTVVKVASTVGDAVLAEDRVDSHFDAKNLPKDEQANLDARKVEKALLAETGKTIAAKLKGHAAKLAEWRMIEANASIKANDAEAAARSFAQLTGAATLSDNERRVMKDLEQYLMNRYR